MKKKNSTDDIKVNEIPLNRREASNRESVNRTNSHRDEAKRPKQNFYQKNPINKTPDPKRKNKDILRVAYVFSTMFLMLVGYLVYFNLIKADEINSNANNTKQDAQAQKVIRGSILSSDGEILAATNVDTEGKEERIYPYENIFSHVVGYDTNGKSGIEANANNDLLKSSASILDQVENESNNQKLRGDNVILTLDSQLQTAVYNAMGAYKGAAVVMEPSTGKILAMVSKPDFNPNTISEDWELLINDETNSSLLNRASQGLYPPGSTFKILTALEYIREHPQDYQNYVYNCTGSISKEDVRITCYDQEVHGEVNLASAFKYSCNSFFANIGMELDNKSWRTLCDDFLFNSSLPVTMESSMSRFELNENSSFGDEMTTAIGQGNTLTSPLHMAMISSAVANAGVMMKPYLIDGTETYNKDKVKETSPEKYKEVMSSKEAAILSDYMSQVVSEGTAKALISDTYSAAGKTGSAEYEINQHGEETSIGTHSWFVGFASTTKPDIAISVIAEDGGTGSSAAVPIAKAIFDAYYANKSTAVNTTSQE